MTQDPLEAIKRLYYGTSKATIERDFDAAIDLLKSMPAEEDRDRAAVYMEGLAEMRKQWASRSARASGAPRSAAPRARSDRSTRGGRRPR